MTLSPRDIRDRRRKRQRLVMAIVGLAALLLMSLGPVLALL